MSNTHSYLQFRKTMSLSFINTKNSIEGCIDDSTNDAIFHKNNESIGLNLF